MSNLTTEGRVSLSVSHPPSGLIPNSEPPLYICRTDAGEGAKDYVTLLSPVITSSLGLVAEAIVGTLLKPIEPGKRNITPDAFAHNSAFVNFMHEVIIREAPKQPGAQAEAKRLGEGWIYIIDERAGARGTAVGPEDLIGAFKVRDGQIVLESYSPNRGHRILSERGFFKLEAGLLKLLLQALIVHSSRPTTVAS
jgi:hypothetical protein